MNSEEFNQYRGKHVKIDNIDCPVVGYNKHIDNQIIVGRRMGFIYLHGDEIIEKECSGYCYVDTSKVY